MGNINEYLTLDEWTAKVDQLCRLRLRKTIHELDVGVLFREAWEEGATPEEFFEVDLIAYHPPQGLHR